MSYHVRSLLLNINLHIHQLTKLSNAIKKSSMGITGVQKLTTGVPHKRHLNKAKRQSNFYVNILLIADLKRFQFTKSGWIPNYSKLNDQICIYQNRFCL